ncbi:hypothetical protein A7A08_01848 [Methyloligella halotolerans]|uniref:Uncharacterized protein n=1 Tax=Methyloligella halotolerans TaxID=1177755 RepID=A0A1E2RY74_9HYPH|nr:hypothetical protein A7A08_01848 [Methyloligella halotolerans]
MRFSRPLPMMGTSPEMAKTIAAAAEPLQRAFSPEYLRAMAGANLEIMKPRKRKETEDDGEE